MSEKNLRIKAMSMDSHIARTAATRYTSDKLYQAEGMECEANVMVTQAFIEHGSEKEHHRPRLRLCGEVKALRGAFPYGISEVVFGESRNCPNVEFRYAFTDDELAELCQKGLFNDGFRCPNIFFNNEFELPLTCSINAIQPEYEGEVPLMFIRIEEQYNLETSSELSGYTIADYFEAPTPENEDEYIQDDLDYEDDLADSNDYMFEEQDEQPEVVEEVEEEHILSDEDMQLHEALQRVQSRVQDKVLGVKKTVEHKSLDKVNEDEAIMEESEEMLFDDDVTYESDTEADLTLTDVEVLQEAESIEDEFEEDSLIDDFDEVSEPEVLENDMTDSFDTEEQAVVEEFESEVTDDVEAEADEVDDTQVTTEVLEEIQYDKPIQQQIVKQNQMANQEETIRFARRREIPSHLQDVANADNNEFASEDDFGDSL